MKTDEKLRAGENLFSWLLLVVSLAVLVMAYRISGFSSVSSPGMFPMVASAVMVISMIFVLLGNRHKARPEAGGLKEELWQAVRTIMPPVFLVFTAIIIGYMIAIEPLHFLPSSFIFLVLSMVYLHGTKLLKAILISLVTMACIYFIFHYFFKVVLP